MEAVTSQIRSVLISTKGKSDLRQLQKDYKMLMGEDIPYKKLGYSDLETFIRSISSLNVIQASNGHLLVEAIPTNKTKHMVQLISKQKTAKKKSGGRLPPRYSTKQTIRTSRSEKSTQSTANQQWRAAFANRAKIRPHVHQIVVSVDSSKVSGSNNSTGIQQRLVRNVSVAPSPPPRQQPTENTARKNQKLVRSSSSPLGMDHNNILRDQRTPPLQVTSSTNSSPTSISPNLKAPSPVNNESRPRMRFVNNLTSPSPPPYLLHAGASICGPRHPPPSLSQTDMDAIMRESIEQSNRGAWRWSLPNESIPSKNKISPKNNDTELKRRFSDYSVQSKSVNNFNSGPLEELKEFAKANNLGEVFVRVLPRAMKNSRAQLYDCSIKIDNHSYSSYPRDCSTALEAEKEAARQAFLELSIKYSADRKNKKLLVATEQDVLTRIPPIIERHFHGVWASQLVLDYEDQYSEQLPVNWLALLDTLPTISVEPTLDNRYVLKVCKIGEKNVLSYPVRSQLSTDVSVPSNKIKLSEEGWPVQVTCAMSTVEIWCRMIGSKEAERYFNENQRMQEYYSSLGNQDRATNVTTGGFYVAQFDNCWSRVRVLATGEHDVTCFFIDFGDEQVVPRSDMYELKREFAKEQAQAFVCCLSGLEELANMKAAQNRLEKLAGKTYHAKPQLHEAKAEPDGPEAISIILYGSENSEDGDVIVEDEEDINRLLIRQITHDSVHQLDSYNINRVYVVHATDEGDLYVQLQCEAFNKIDELIKTLDDFDFDKEFSDFQISLISSSQASTEDYQRLYLVKWIQKEGDGQLYRARIIDRSPNGQYVQLYFIDFGNTQIINLEDSGNIYPLDKISEVLNAFPALANRVKLDVELKIDSKTDNEPGFAKMITKLIPSDQMVLLKVIGSIIDENGPVSICEIFRYSEWKHELISVNSSLRYARGNDFSDRELKAEDGNNNDKTTQLVRKLERLRSVSGYADNKPVPSTGELSSPKLPGSGSFLDVRIPFAVNPWNFFVQPYNTATDLVQLMEKLQIRYADKDRRNLKRVQLEDIVPGKIYASKHNDGVWYRTSVIKIINSGSISVFYCDVGYYANLTVEQLVPLDPEFLILPYQAIKARLAGIKPRDTKWTMNDCRYFEDLVRCKNFVSVVVAVQQDELYKCDTVLVLRLIDTSTEKDVHVDQLLIEAGIAAQA